MYDDLVKRLREHNGWALNKTLDEAADAIEELSTQRRGNEEAVKVMQMEIDRLIASRTPKEEK